jgi:hypothetical protein
MGERCSSGTLFRLTQPACAGRDDEGLWHGDRAGQSGLHATSARRLLLLQNVRLYVC